ncbi:MAG: hypothetical protein RIT41_1303, partial [Bacteroidota bacterium]
LIVISDNANTLCDIDIVDKNNTNNIINNVFFIISAQRKK